MADVMKLAQVREKLESFGIDPRFIEGHQLATFIANERKRWGSIIKEANIHVD
jgi:tripartite-type tricarboxylate transporter receptor subunit TctC